MKIHEKVLYCTSRRYTIKLYVLGDLHIGARNCDENKIKTLVKLIEKDPHAYWIGGGDLCDNIVIGDSKRFEPTVLPRWMLDNKDADEVAAALQDIAGAQKDRLFNILKPIKDKCLGMIEGNHEYTIMKHHNRDLMKELCAFFNAPNLTDCAFVRLRFIRKSKSGAKHTATVTVFITHGHGGGRTSGAEPNSLYRLAADKGVDIVLKGHSHTYCIHPPIPMLYIPSGGALPSEARVKYKYAANWGALVLTYQDGPGTYASRANYPVRPMYTVQTIIKPFHFDNAGNDVPDIEMIPVKL